MDLLQVIGDLNDGNFLVDADGSVAILDCDSFQYKHWLCTVGRPDFTAPELQSVDFEQVRRANSSDCFSLAIIVYQLLVLGQHPYMGRATGPQKTKLTALRVGAEIN